MSTIKVNDQVKVVSSECYLDMFTGCIGKVLRIHETLTVPVAIVELEDGTTVKLSINDLVKIEVKVQQTEESKVEIPEGAKRITDEDYKIAVSESASDFSVKNGDFMRGMSGVIIGADIGKKLFESQDSVVMTKDEFIVTLWDGCSPENIRESTGGKMPIDKSLTVSISGIIALRKVADILFDDESEELG